MIVKFRVVRKDTKAAIQGAKIVLEHGESDGITNSAGEAEIITYWSGNMMYSVDAAGYTKLSGTVQVPSSGTVILAVEMGAYAAPPVPPPSGEEIISTVGQSCDIMQKYMFGYAWYRYRNRYTGGGSAWDSELDDARQRAYKDTSCANPPPPPPATVGDVQKDVDILRGTLQGISSRVQDLVTTMTALSKALADLEARIKGMIDSAITTALAPIMTLINAVTSRTDALEKRMNGIQIPTLPDFNALISNAVAAALAPITASITALKAWITETVFELLLKNLDAGTREWRKQQI